MYIKKLITRSLDEASVYIQDIVERDSFTQDVKSTAQSFRHWDTCMANRTCKIVAIVGICLASLFVLWMLMTFIQCLCMGATCIEALCCCCCRNSNRPVYSAPPQQPQYNPNMYPPNHHYNTQMRQPPVPMYETSQPAQAHFTQDNYPKYDRYGAALPSPYNDEEREPVYRVVKV
ncbi:uncharacterized protein RJT21DRAFT_45909 [Scheffersomyces amazonensis]|uniref:uncharacterized protein n=1 Tax=Scheffersomyces amazonensis TaxID=1078765 RepID=UPI00315CB8DD